MTTRTMGAVRAGTVRGSLAILACFAAAGCGLTDPPERLPITLWDASLAPVSGVETTVTGQAAAVTRQRVTEVGIGVTSVPPDMVLRWGFFRGSCSDPGDMLGAEINYPTLSGETTTGEGVIGVRLQADEVYHAAVLDDADGQRLACGDLTLQSD